MALTKVSGNLIQQQNFNVGVVTATSFTGDLTGDVTGNVTGDVTGDLTGNVTGNVSSSGANTLGSLTVTNDATVGGALTVTGNLTVNGTTTTIDTVVTAIDTLAVDGDVTAGGNLNVTGVSTFQGNVNLGDNDQLRFGAGDDLKIYHDVTSSAITNDTGRLFIRNNTDDEDILLQTDDGSGGVTSYIRCDGSEGSVKAYHYGSVKFETTGFGVTVAGGVYASGVSTFTDNIELLGSTQIGSGSNQGVRITEDGIQFQREIGDWSVANSITFTPNSNGGTVSVQGRNFAELKGDRTKLSVGYDGDITGYTYDGSSASLQRFVVKQTTGNVGINSTQPTAKLDVVGDARVTGILTVGQNSTTIDGAHEYPTIRPTLDLNFAATKTLDRRITFTRDSIGTYIDELGIIRTVSNNTPRFDHDPITGESLGLLIEESRTNLITYSEDFGTTWGQTNSSVSTNVAIAPDGTMTADKIVENSSSAFHFASFGVTMDAEAVVFSCYMKASERTEGSLFLTQIGNNGARFNLDTGTVTQVLGTGNTAEIQDVGNGWYRCIVKNDGSNDLGNSVRIGPNNGAIGSYQGDGTSGIYVWGAQVEVGSFPTSYIPTSGSTVTRAIDLVKITGTSLTSFLRQGEGSVICSGVLNGLNTASDYQNWWSLDQSNTTHRIWLYARSGASRNQFIGGDGSTQFAISSSSNTVVGQKYKLACAYKENDIAFYEDGIQLGTDTIASLPTVTHFGIGSRNDTQLALNGTISNLSYYRERLPNAQLQGLTAQ